MVSSVGGARRRSPAEAHAAIERFLDASRQPILLEAGADRFPLVPGQFAVEFRDGLLSVQAWDETRNHVRRVTGLIEEKPGKLTLAIEKFPKREGSLQLIDVARPALAGVARQERRLSFREEFRRLLAREFAGWKISELSSELDLQHSLSPAYSRALLRKGGSGLAAIGASAGSRDVDGALSFGLIWLDYLRRREPRLAIEGLALFLPQGREKTTCLRLRFLDAGAAKHLAYVYSPEGFAARVDLNDYGNLDTRLEPCRDPAAGLSRRVLEWIERLARLPHVERVGRTGGAVSLCVRGTEFARALGDTLEFGLERRTPAGESNLAEIEAMARELARMRSPDAADRGNPLYRQQPESWLESRIRERLEEVDPALAGSPIYSQAPSFAAGERGLLDLLAVERSGRLAVLELKASEDVHLPLQALDYWMRVQWHLTRGEFGQQGYFPGIPLRKEPPRLLLVAPSLHFHPTTETILRFFTPEIQVERIGLGVEWRRKLKVAFRLRGCEGRG
jgi:hypothetical protein